MTTKPKAIALLRVSSAAQAGPDRQGLPVQRATCERIAATHCLNIVEWVELEGVSGAAVLADARFAALLQRLQSREIHAVVVAAFDRLFRRGRFSDYAILDAFAETGTRLFSADGELDLNEESGGLLGVLRGELAGMERRRIIERTKAGRRRKRRELGVRAEGLVGMPRAVAFDHESGKWCYVWPEAERVRQVFRLFLAGVQNLAELHRRTGVGSKSEPSSAILRLLRQPLYAGIYRVDRTWEGGHPTPLPPEDIQEHSVIDPPLVSRAEFDEVQRILARLQGTRPTRRDPDSLGSTYAGHLFCGRCGAPLRVQTDRHSFSGYACWRRMRHRCDMGQVSVRLADGPLDEQMEAILGDLDTLALLLEASTRDAGRRASPSAHEVVKRLDELQGRRRRIHDAYEAGLFDLGEAQKRSRALEAQRAELEALVGQDRPIEVPDGLVADLVEVFGTWRDLRRHEKRSLLASYRAEIVVERQGAARRSWLKIDRMRLAAFPADLWLYKKMKRLGVS